ncbi:MAG: glycosyltransferase family 2 protein [Cytophaga sp.]|uniref:glycosyltransferase family 2 protein n=1 Tax=Cytophaga sp. TaxID=29535 RepID=UPI003F7E3FBC
MDITALIITYNEEPNIARVLDKLRWLPKVLIIDSGSTDQTLPIISEYENVEVVYRKFDTFAIQCNFGMELIQTKWTLSLDADYVLTDEFIAETKKYIQENDCAGYATRFKFCVDGHPLKRNNTTPRIVLFQTEKGKYFDDGHAHRLELDGIAGSYTSYILHDDRKDLTRWFYNQNSYSIREANKLLSKHNNELRFTDKIRKLKWAAPIFVFFHCLFIKGLILDGWYGWHYTLQRTLVEIMFCLRLIEEDKFNNTLNKK